MHLCMDVVQNVSRMCAPRAARDVRCGRRVRRMRRGERAGAAIEAGERRRGRRRLAGARLGRGACVFVEHSFRSEARRCARRASRDARTARACRVREVGRRGRAAPPTVSGRAATPRSRTRAHGARRANAAAGRTSVGAVSPAMSVPPLRDAPHVRRRDAHSPVRAVDGCASARRRRMVVLPVAGIAGGLRFDDADRTRRAATCARRGEPVRSPRRKNVCAGATRRRVAGVVSVAGVAGVVRPARPPRHACRGRCAHKRRCARGPMRIASAARVAGHARCHCDPLIAPACRGGVGAIDARASARHGVARRDAACVV